MVTRAALVPQNGLPNEPDCSIQDGPFWALGAPLGTQVPLVGILMPLMSIFYRFVEKTLLPFFVKILGLCQDIVPDEILPRALLERMLVKIG